MKCTAWLNVIFLIGTNLHNCLGGFFDYTDIDDPFQILWNTKILLFEMDSWNQLNATDQVISDSDTRCSGNVSNMLMEGVCKPRSQCQLTGGVSASGSCGLLSTCCIYIGGCGSRSSAKIAYFQNIGGLGDTNQQICSYQVQLHNRNICQLRLDFLSMSLSAPARNDPVAGTCRDEKFFVEGHPDVPEFCGKNSGQHLYVPVNGILASPVKLHVYMEAMSRSRWTVQVTQLQCPGTNSFPYRTSINTIVKDYQLLAPQGCLQYFPDMKGSLRSFGFDTTDPLSSSYNVNQTYAICFKRHPGVCSVRFLVDYFKVGTTSTQTAGGSSTSNSDVLYVPGLQSSVAVIQNERINGQQDSNAYFSSVTPGPFYVYFNSDSNPDIVNDVGFNIRYELAAKCL